MKEQGYDIQEIALANEKAAFVIPESVPVPDLSETDAADSSDYVALGTEDYFSEQSGVDDSGLDLTDEELIYLRLKWGKTYKPEEWVRLEQLYTEMMESYDIQAAGHIDTLKLICKASLKSNQLLDIGDIEGAQKAIKMYDSLMKSGKFTAAQNKAESGEYVDSIGELVAICEKEGFIPRYYVSEPNDKVDQTIEDLKLYTKTLITEETNLGSLIEEAVKNNQKEDEASLLEDDSDADESDNAVRELEEELRDDDFEDYNDFIDNEETSDADLLDFLASQKDVS